MKSRIAAILLFAVLAICSLGISSVASAAGTVCVGANQESRCDPLRGACYGASSVSSVCTNNSSDNPISGANGIILKAVTILSFVVGIVCIIIIITAGIRYITSQGDSTSVSGAKNQILYALIGLVVVITARTIIAFAISKL